MRPCSVYLNANLLASVPKSGLRRSRILGFLTWLQEHPDTPGDFSCTGADQREFQVKEVGGDVISWWLDSPVNIIMVIDIRTAGNFRDKIWK